MKRISILGLAISLAIVAVSPVIACSSPRPEPSSQATTPSSVAAPESEPGRSAGQVQHDPGLAYFAGGCFWGVEHYLEQLEGVLSVESGYMGGHVESPSYEQVSSQTSGHLETVRVRFDPERISYESVAKRFFEIHDPTQADGQGPDLGPEYRSAVFYTSAEQRQTSEALIEQLLARGYQVVTELREAGTFWAAEDYHQNYYAKTGKTPYCHTRVQRFGE